jgi:hypothetical protein
MFMHHVFNKSTPIPLVEKSITNIIKYFADPFSFYKKTNYKITLTNNLTLCHSLCICHLNKKKMPLKEYY